MVLDHTHVNWSCGGRGGSVSSSWLESPAISGTQEYPVGILGHACAVPFSGGPRLTWHLAEGSLLLEESYLLGNSEVPC